MAQLKWLCLCVAALWGCTPQTQVLVVEDCNIVEQACEVEIAGHTVSLELSPKQFLPMQPIQAQVHTSLPLARVQLEFRGRNMQMPALPYPLQAQQAGQWQGQAMLAMCTLKKMDWRAVFSLESKTAVYHLAIDFSTQRP